MYLVTTEEMKQWETYWENKGMSMAALMEVAGQRAYYFARTYYGFSRQSKITVLAGYGNNGGDALVFARLASMEGIPVQVVRVGNIDRSSALANTQTRLLKECGIPTYDSAKIDDAISFLRNSDIIVEGIVGTGVKGNLRPETARWVHSCNICGAEGCKVIALDVPAGVNSNTGQCGEIVLHADTTLVFGQMKVGLVLYPGKIHAGNTVFLSLGLPTGKFSEICQVKAITEKNFHLPKRLPTAHKGKNGHVGIFAGSEGMEGAALLAAKAALAAGAGKVTLVVPGGIRHILAGKVPEVMVKGIGEKTYWTAETVQEMDLSVYDAIAIGCGIGRQRETIEWVRCMMEIINCPSVWDADALYALAVNEKCKLPSKSLITPHVGEASRLLSISAWEIERDRIDNAKNLAMLYKCTSVLKGAPTIIAALKGKMYVNTSGNAGLATAGTGDTLTGIIAALLAQGMSDVEAAAMGVYWHGAAGDIAYNKAGVGFTAGDVALYLPLARKAASLKEE